MKYTCFYIAGLKILRIYIKVWIKKILANQIMNDYGDDDYKILNMIGKVIKGFNIPEGIGVVCYTKYVCRCFCFSI